MLQGCSRAEHVTSTILCSVNWARNNVWGDSHRYLQTVLCHREQGGDLGAVSIGGCHCSSSSTSPAIQMAAYERTCSRPLARASPPVRVLLPDPLVDESHPLRALWDTWGTGTLWFSIYSSDKDQIATTVISSFKKKGKLWYLTHLWAEIADKHQVLNGKGCHWWRLGPVTGCWTTNFKCCPVMWNIFIAGVIRVFWKACFLK